ncbi:MAG: thiamine pyrophosphate-binding protein [Burkholderiales bacterium]
MKVVEFLLGTLERNGVESIFGNPGTTEIPLVRACERRRKLRYVVALSEVAAVPMADGYARARRTLGVVNLHVAPGLGNGMGALYTAGVAGTPLLVLIGGQDRRFLHTQPILWGPVEQMARAVCKACFGLNTRYDAPANVRRALRAALTPPYAPVALICPPDLLEQNVDAMPSAVQAPALGGLGAEAAEEYARFMSWAKRPAIVAAEDVYWSDAAAAVESLAAAFNAPVFAAPYTGVLPISSDSPCYAGYLPPSVKQIADRLDLYDSLLFLGGRGMRTTLYSDAQIPARKAWIGHDPAVQAIDGEFELAHVADMGSALKAIGARVRAKRTHAKAEPLRAAIALPAAKRDVLHPTRAVAALLERFGDAIWFDESGLSTSDVRQWMRLQAGDYIVNGSGGIGWGLAAAVGGALAQPERQIVAAIGDGSSLYASEAMWTAGHHGTKVLLVVFSNRRYATLNEAAGRLAGGALDAFTIEPPVLDFSGLAKLYGWEYALATSEPELQGLVGRTSRVNSNTLLELRLDPTVKPVTASRHF